MSYNRGVQTIQRNMYTNNGILTLLDIMCALLLASVLHFVHWFDIVSGWSKNKTGHAMHGRFV